MDQSADQAVKIDFAPEVPKEPAEFFIAVLEASRVVHQELTEYVKTGSIQAARKAGNALIFGSGMRTKTHYARMLSMIIRGQSPLTDAQREAVKEELQQRGMPGL